MTKSPSFQQKICHNSTLPGKRQEHKQQILKLNATQVAHLYYRIHSLETLAIQLKQTNLFNEELVKDH